MVKADFAVLWKTRGSCRAESFVILPVLNCLPSSHTGCFSFTVLLQVQNLQMVTEKIVPTRECGEAHKRLVVNSALLSLIDPVRGAPTKSLLDGHPDDDFLKCHQLKERFLDSFALICSTSGCGKETASAVCMEQNQASETILRVARNHGLSNQDRNGLERVLQILVATANGEKLSMQAETEALEEVVDLDKNRILSLVQKLEKGGIQRVFQLAISRLFGGDCHEEILEDPCFGRWIKTCPFTGTHLSSSGSSQLFSLVKWASQARWVYPKHLQILLAFGPTSTPSWMETFHKLARYWAAIKSMIKFAMKQPAILASIHIRDVEAPQQQTFSLFQEQTPLRKALKKLVKTDYAVTMAKLAQRWETDDVEATLRRACRLTLTLHAEMQLVDFYERNPALVPQLRLMGTSKKACYLCHEFLLRHPLRIRVSACHQKVYPTWMPPSSRDIPGVARKKLFWSFSKHIEHVTVRELRTGLAAAKRPRNKDSTAGPSLTVTATVPTRSWGGK
ncbi:hypothetical protein JX265_003006 [Neoarthrinium moseri]|uniref:Uncharacterized protein n=1 Tax=Neoarthrinium moseri TaxID=1658444 RepID=A0A9P9WTF7_9PEZI|nr:hypothetical protein JX265_003006 [Neoarthrinium moseri]